MSSAVTGNPTIFPSSAMRTASRSLTKPAFFTNSRAVRALFGFEGESVGALISNRVHAVIRGLREML